MRLEKKYLKQLEDGKAPTSASKLIAYLDTRWEEWAAMEPLKQELLVSLNSELQKIFNKKISMLKGTAEQKDQLLFDFKVRCFKGDENSLSEELMVIKNRYEGVLTEINQLENNLQFFNDTSDSNPLVKEVKSQLESLNQKAQCYLDQLTQLRQELRSIRSRAEEEVKEATEEETFSEGDD